MNLVDIIILLCLIPIVISGYRHGFIRQAIGLIGLILGIWASYHFAATVSGWIGQWIEASGPAINITSFVLVFICVFLVLTLLGRLLEGIISIAMLGWLNKLLGILFSCIKWGLVIGLILICFSSVNNQLNLVSPNALAQSHLYNPLLSMAQSVFPYIRSFLFG